MVKVMIYGYATGVFSSRGLARKLEEDVAFRVLEFSEPGRRVSPPSFGGFQPVCGGGASGARDRRCELRQVVDRRDEGSSQRQQAQGDELSDAGGGAAWIAFYARFGEAHRGDELPVTPPGGSAGGEGRDWRPGNGRPVRSATGRAGGHTSGNTASRTRRARSDRYIDQLMSIRPDRESGREDRCQDFCRVRRPAWPRSTTFDGLCRRRTGGSRRCSVCTFGLPSAEPRTVIALGGGTYIDAVNRGRWIVDLEESRKGTVAAEHLVGEAHFRGLERVHLRIRRSVIARRRTY